MIRTDLTHPLIQSVDEAEYKAELLYQKNLLLFILDYLPTGVFAKDCKDDFKYILWNKKMEEIHSVSWRDVVGKRDMDFQPNADLALLYFKEDVELVKSLGASHLKCKETIRRDNKDYIFYKHKVLFLDKDGLPDLLVGVMQDITSETQTDAVSKTLMASIVGDVVDRNRNYILHRKTQTLIGALEPKTLTSEKLKVD